MQIQAFEGVFPNMDFITSPDTFFETVKEEYPAYLESGFFYPTHREAILLYRIQAPARSFTGVVACASVEDYLSDTIRRHEHTLADKEQTQTQLLLHRRAAVKPVLLTYPNVSEVDTWIESYIKTHQPFYEVKFENEFQQHCFWQVEHPAEIRQIQVLFEQYVKVAYVADGHHRAATVAMLQERTKGKPDAHRYDRFLCAWFAASELEIQSFHRLVDGLEHISPATFMARLSKICDIDIEPGEFIPATKFEMGMFLHEEWYRLRWKKQVLEEYVGFPVVLDATLLNDKILRDILGIENVRNDLRVEYHEAPRGIESLQRRTLRSEHTVAFLLHPIELSELITAADAGEALPPKSTWFEPRMKNGLVVQEF